MLGSMEAGPVTLAEIVDATGIARPTAHRIAVALSRHRLVSREDDGRFAVGPRIIELGAAAGEDRLMTAAAPVLQELRDYTGESAHLYRWQGEARMCVAVAERPVGLRESIPVGATLSMAAGSAAQVLLAWEDLERLQHGLGDATFTAADLAGVRRRGWAQSVAERAAGMASVSAPVRLPSGQVIAAISIFGPVTRLTGAPGQRHAQPVVAAADRLSDLLAADA
ncbi:MAG: IclR family transcriptional regulator [Promicromonosporaceae bacterium]|nr:IclR family transcriptional regulator [Promicromonosporaceae bacterium]